MTALKFGLDIDAEIQKLGERPLMPSSNLPMSDKKILKDREAKYGKAHEFFTAYGAMCEILDRYGSIGQGEIYDLRRAGKGEANYAHLSAMKMVILKVLRSVWNPGLKDNYADARNYVSIAEDIVTRNRPIFSERVKKSGGG